jgi:hypothetical protein
MKYVVEIGYRKYEFDDVNTATNFMALAVEHCNEDITSITDMSMTKEKKDDQSK